MSKPTNNELKDLLNNKTQNVDNFEQDAIEGFDSLESHDEAFDLKSELDKEINNKLFNEEENNKKGIIWFAAAGLILTLGLGILFVKSDLFKPEQKDNLALNEKQEIKPNEETPKGELNESINANKQAEVVSDLKSETKKIVSEKYISGKEEKPAKYFESKETEKNSSIITSESDKIADDAVLDREEQKSVSAPLELNGTIEATPKSSINDEFAKEADAKKLAKKKAITEYKNTNKDVAKEEEVREKSDKNTGAIAVNSKSNSNPRSNSNVSTTNSSSTNSLNQKATPVINEAGAGVTKSSSAETIDLATDADNKPANEITCNYKGGKELLNKEIKIELTKLNLNKAFKAKLLLNENLNVKEVTFIDRNNFNKKELKKLKQILLNVKQFEKPITNLLNTILVGYIDYEP